MAIEYLETLGRARDEVSDIAQSPIGQVVKEFTDEMIESMRAKLAPRNADGVLSNSLQFEFETGKGAQITINLLAEDYWDFINSGVDGTETPFGSPYSFSDIAKTQSSGLNFQESIELWMTTRGIVAEDGDQESLAFVIMQSVKKGGIRPTPYVDETLTEARIKRLEDDIVIAFNSMF